jgi:hypothetical protein
VAESLDSSFIAPFVRRATSGRLVIVGPVEIMAPFIMMLTLESVSLLVTILNAVTSVSITDDVPKISLSLATLI